MNTSTCSRPRCQRPASTRGLCESDYRRRIRMGFHGYVEAAPVLAHIERLRELGWSWQQIADASGTSSSTAHGLYIGRYRRMLRDSAEAILAVPAVRQRSHRGLDSTGTRRRIHALQWMGWPVSEIARRLDIPVGTIPTLMYRGRLSARLVADVARVYDQLSHLPGPSKQSATKARAAGHAPPAAWDDETIDDPAAKPRGQRRIDVFVGAGR